MHDGTGLTYGIITLGDLNGFEFLTQIQNKLLVLEKDVFSDFSLVPRLDDINDGRNVETDEASNR